MTRSSDLVEDAGIDLVRVGARVGIAAYGVTHLLVAWLALQLAFGGSGRRADQSGAFQTLASGTLGRVLLWVLTGGFVAVTVWLLWQAGWGFRYLSDRTARLRRRAASAGRALAFVALAARAALGGKTGGGGALPYFALDGSDYPSHASQEAAIAGYIRCATRHARPKRRFAPESKIRRPDYLPNVA